MSNKSNHNSFYEQKDKNDKTKKISEVDWKKTSKIGLKLFKWMIYIFLSITTLWGCVQEFTIKSSPFLSQGVETYKNDDEVLPNLYFTSYNYSYVGNVVEDSEGNEKTNPFPNIMYPVFHKNDEGMADYSQPVYWTDFESAQQISNDENSEYISYTTSFSYNASLLDVSVWTNLILFSQAQSSQTINNQGIYFLPYYKTATNEDEKSQWISVEQYNGDLNNISTNSSDYITSPSQTLFNYSSYDTTNLVESDFNALRNVDKAIGLTNLVGFYKGESISPSDVNNLVNSSNSNDTKNLQQIIDDNLNVIANSETISQEQKDYYENSFRNYETIDYSKMFAKTKLSNDAEFGVNLWVTSQNKNQPLIPSNETYNYLYNENGINEIRDQNWKDESYDSSKYSSNEDTSIANAGWLFMDNNGDRIEFQNKTTNEVEYLQAQTLYNGLGADASEQQHLTNNENGQYDYRSNINDLNNYLINSYSTRIGNRSYEFKFTDSSNVEYSVNFNDEQNPVMANYLGFSSVKTLEEQNDGNPLIVNPDKSIGDVSEYQSYNSNRIAISSWGEAWNYGPFYGLFVYPISMLANIISEIIPYSSIGAWSVLIAVFIIVFLFRGLASLFSIKSTRNQQKMQEIQLKVAQINAKYDMYKDNKNMKQRKQMETMALYKKEGINPLSSLGSIFLTLPIFLAMWTIVSTLPLYKIAAFGPMLLSVSPFYGIFHLFFQTAGLYLLIGILVGVLQWVSFKLPNYLAQKREGIRNLDDATKKQMKKSGKMTNIMLVVFIFIGLTIPALLSIYWIFSSLFTIVLTFSQHLWKERKASKVKS